MEPSRLPGLPAGLARDMTRALDEVIWHAMGDGWTLAMWDMLDINRLLAENFA